MSSPHHSDPHADAAHHGVGHIVQPSILIGTAFALLVLTVITVWSARFDFGAGNIYIALGIALLKGSLVALFFMHLRWDRPFNQLVFVGSLAFVVLFITFAITDTFEYRGEIIQQNGATVQEKLTALQAELAATPAPTNGHEGDDHAAPANHGAPDAH